MPTSLTISLLFFFLTPAALPAIPECQVRVLHTLTDDLGNQWKPGSILPVTIERDNANGGSYCASGGSCLPRKVDGANALTLLNCKVGPSIGNGDWRLIPSAALAGKATAQAMLSRDETERKLSGLGFSNASAGSLAGDYVNHPQSPTAKLVAKALAGSATALATLKRNHP